MARLQAKRAAEAQQRHYDEVAATTAHEQAPLEAKRQHQDAAARRERRWAKTSALLQDILTKYHREQAAERAAVQQEVHELVEAQRAVEVHEERERIRRLTERFD